MAPPSTTEEEYVPEKGLAPKLSLLRWKLGRKATQEPNFRFYTLYDRISREDVLEESLKRVRANGGSPGVDGVRVEDVTASPEAKATFLAQVRKELVETTYRPMAVRRVWIPKASGGMRALGVPTVKDRVGFSRRVCSSWSRYSSRTSMTVHTGFVPDGLSTML